LSLLNPIFPPTNQIEHAQSCQRFHSSKKSDLTSSIPFFFGLKNQADFVNNSQIDHFCHPTRQKKMSLTPQPRPNQIEPEQSRLMIKPYL